jgi:small conductance mechanosensitive channel
MVASAAVRPVQGGHDGAAQTRFLGLAVSAGTSIAQSGLRILLALAAGYVAVRFLRIAMRRLEEVLIRAGEKTEPAPGATRKRVTTLTGLLLTLSLVAIWAVVIVICLGQIGFDVTPIVAGAGIVGLAVGFGAQNLVRDVISGCTIVLRDLAGVVYVIPNGTITTLANMTKGWSGYVVDVGVAYEDTDRVVEVMREVGEDLRKDPRVGPSILEPIEVFGVDDFKESEVTIKARLKTRPMQQWDVGREYRRRLKKAFDARGIEIPFPHRSLYMGTASSPLEVMVRTTPTAGNGDR